MTNDQHLIENLRHYRDRSEGALRSTIEAAADRIAQTGDNPCLCIPCQTGRPCLERKRTL